MLRTDRTLRKQSLQIMERKVEIIQRVLQWRRENEQHGIEVTLTNTWTPEERQRFLAERSDGDTVIDEWK